MLYVAWKRGLPWKSALLVLFRPIKNRSLNLLCVLDLFSEHWQSTLFPFFFFYPNTAFMSSVTKLDGTALAAAVALPRKSYTSLRNKVHYAAFQNTHTWTSIPTGSPPHGGDVTVYVPDINQPSLPTPFYSVLMSVSVFMALSTVLHSINSPSNSLLSCSVLLNSFCPIGPLNYICL